LTIETVGDPFLVFNPKNDVNTGKFVALTIGTNEVRIAKSFYVAKVLEFGQRSWGTRTKVVWYYLIMMAGVEDASSFSAQGYKN